MDDHKLHANYSRGREELFECACGWSSGWQESYSVCRWMHLTHINEQADSTT